MKTNNLVVSFLSIIAIYGLACTKENTATNTSINNSSVNNAVAMSPCDSFAYADTIFYPAELPNDYIVKPKYKLTGTFGAYPDGLEINTNNGNIDITESETGLKYLVWYVPFGRQDTCKKFITVSGINYVDSVFILTSTDPGIVKPVYNATLLKPTDCNGNCEFDDGNDDDDGDGFADEPLAGQEVIPQGVAMDKLNGNFNLKKSLKNGALGINPQNGAVKTFRLNYRISDKSSRALNKIRFRLYYYKTKADIPATLLKQIQAKKKLVLFNDTDTDPYKVSYTVPATASSLVARETSETRCRPPYIIVTSK
jgi:hypothetical protein